MAAAGVAQPNVLRRLFKAFDHRDFRVMWLGACTSSIGTWMQQLAQAWLVYDLSKDPFYLGLDTFLAQFPIMALSLFGGVFADRTNRRNQLLMSQYIQMACAFALTLLIVTGHVKVWHILVLSFVVGVGQSFGGPAYQALLPTLVGKEDMSNAIVLNSIQFNIARVIGPTLGGLALASLGAAWCFGLNGLSFIAVIASLFMITVRYVPAKSSEPILVAMKKGFAFIREREGMEPLIILAFLMTLLGLPLSTFLPVFAKEVFNKGADAYTVFLVCSGLGSVFGAITLGAIGKVQKQGRATLLVLALLGALIIAFALCKWLPLSCMLLFCCGATLMASFSLVATLVQAICSDEMRGRVMSVYNVAFRGGMPVGGLILGRVIPVVGVSVTIACVGGLLVCVALYFLLVHRRIADI
jgi:predicted MFS family arabinose efflux permease